MSARVFDFDTAMVRMPAPSVVDGLRSGAGAGASYEGVLAEHRAYAKALERAGLAVEALAPLESYPDSVFVEDPAFVVPKGAILLRPGAPSRAGEADEIAPALRRHFDRVLALDAGRVDGGDILILSEEILIGLSDRTDRVGASRFVELAGALGRRARIVATPPGVLHLKTACALLDEETVIVTGTIAAAGIFDGVDLVTIPAGEEAAANLLRINEVVLVAAGYPRTATMLSDRGHEVIALAAGEIGKIDAGLSCMSLRWRAK